MNHYIASIRRSLFLARISILTNSVTRKFFSMKMCALMVSIFLLLPSTDQLLANPATPTNSYMTDIEKRVKEILGDWEEKNQALKISEKTDGLVNTSTELAAAAEQVIDETVKRIRQAKNEVAKVNCKQYKNKSECERQVASALRLIRRAQTQVKVTMEGASWLRWGFVKLVNNTVGKVIETVSGGFVGGDAVGSVGDQLANDIGISSMSHLGYSAANGNTSLHSDSAYDDHLALESAYQADLDQQNRVQQLINGER